MQSGSLRAEMIFLGARALRAEIHHYIRDERKLERVKAYDSLSPL